MKVKAVDIAKKLDISKATVSLALNGKPGVSDKTRQAILKCKEALEKGYGWESEEKVSIYNREAIEFEKESGKVIKILIFDNEKYIVKTNPNEVQMDVFNHAFLTFNEEIRNTQYTLGMRYVKNEKQDILDAILECQHPMVAGVILMAAEMDKESFEPFLAIKKPMVIGDNEFSKSYHCVAINNVGAVKSLVEHLCRRGIRDIVYLMHGHDIYNFEERRAGFRTGLRKHGIEVTSQSFFRTAATIVGIENRVKEYLEEGNHPEAFICENYQVTLGTMQALDRQGLHVPEDISLVGVDEIPEFAMKDYTLTYSKVPHSDRASLLMMLLIREIEKPMKTKYLAISQTVQVYGTSVK